MKKNKIVFIGLLIMILILTGCGKQESKNGNKAIKDLKSEYLKVIDNEKNYTNEDGNSVSIDDFYSALGSYATNEKISYAIMDLDDDGIDEMITLFESSDADYLVLNYDESDNIIYGYTFGYREMIAISDDGVIRGSSGADAAVFYKLKFNKNKYDTSVIAESDNGTYTVNGKKANEKEFNAYVEEFEKKNKITYTKYKEIDISDLKGNHSGTSDSKFKEGNYIQTAPSNVGSEAEGYETSLEMFGGNVIRFEEYYGITTYGTYEINGDEITIIFTRSVGETSFGEPFDDTISVTWKGHISDKKIMIETIYQDGQTDNYEMTFELV